MKMSSIWGESFELTYGSYPSPHHGVDAYGMMFTSDEPCKAICHAVNNHDKLVEALKSLAYCSENNTGAHPSVDCYYRALDESKELLRELGHEI